MEILNVSRDEIRLLGLKAAVLLEELRQQEKKVIENGGFYKDGFFIMPWKEIENEIPISKNLQKKNLDILVSAGFVESKVVLDEDTRTQVRILVKRGRTNDKE